MSSDEFTPDLSSLTNDYQVLSELRHSENARVYLARHRKLNRDVTITVVRDPNGDENALTHLASDARTLAVMRHRNVVPVIEGRWLTEGTLAVVRARVRGSTLEETVESSGAFPVPRVGNTLEQVFSGIEWARSNGIMHRRVSADAIVFQQGSGRVLIELELSPRGPSGMPDSCDDARTIGRLAFEMLSGEPNGDAATKRLAELRPDLAPAIVREIQSLMRCNRTDGTKDAIAVIALLGGRPPVAGLPVPLPQESPAPIAIPVGSSDSAIAVVKRPFGFNARLASGAAVVGIISTFGALLLVQRRGKPEPVSGPTTPPAAIRTAAAGEVELSRRQPKRDTATKAVAPPIVPTPARKPTPPPEPKRRRPSTGLPAFAVPGPVAPIPHDTNAVVTVGGGAGGVNDSAATKSAVTLDSCDSIEPLNQHRCLSATVDRNDQSVTSALERLIAALRQRANKQPNDSDPPTVDSLRQAHQQWLAARDAACKNVGVGLLFARARGQCYADQSDKRTIELTSQLNAVVSSPRDSIR